MDRGQPHLTLSLVPEGTPKVQAVLPPLEGTTTQGDPKECKYPKCDSNGATSSVFVTDIGALGQGHFISTSRYGGWDFPPQPQPRSPYTLGFPQIPAPTRETVGGRFHFPLDHQDPQDAAPSGPLPMLGTGHPSLFDPAFSARTYNPLLETSPAWHVSRVSNNPRLAGPEGRQLYWGVPSPYDPNISVVQRYYQPNLYVPTGKTPPIVNNVPPTALELSTSRDGTVSKQCGWRDKHGTTCGVTITYQCQPHLAMAHGITKLSSNVIVSCKWCDPDNKMRRRCILRHIREVHLGVPRSTGENV
ncbi:hypothetical protein V8B97DRAFT_1964897 [Scleroderma yunnanense]